MRFPGPFTVEITTVGGETIGGRLVDGRHLVTVPYRGEQVEHEMSAEHAYQPDDPPILLAALTHAAYQGWRRAVQAAELESRFTADLRDLLEFIAEERDPDDAPRDPATGREMEIDVFVRSTSAEAWVRRVEMRCLPATPCDALEKVVHVLLALHGSEEAEVSIRIV